MALLLPENWGLQADVDVLNEMAELTRAAETILTDAAPEVFHATWALLVDRDTGRLAHQTPLAPDLLPEQAHLFGPLDTAHADDLVAGWLPDWGATIVAVARAARRPRTRSSWGAPAAPRSSSRRSRACATSPPWREQR